MKQFSCGDVVPGCHVHFSGSTDDEILVQVTRHAASDHRMPDPPASLIGSVLAKIRVAA
jgi:predicted small metal-binding protein